MTETDMADQGEGILAGVMDIARALSPSRRNASDDNIKLAKQQPPTPTGPPTYPRTLRYEPPPEMDWTGYTSSHDTKKKAGQRCYRLNLERPFDLHCEQSPLEYGDYMLPWPKKNYPPRNGPSDYAPPRHLGGDETVWRELMRWSEEEKVGSSDMLETDAPSAAPPAAPSADAELDLKEPTPYADAKKQVDGGSMDGDEAAPAPAATETVAAETPAPAATEKVAAKEKGAEKDAKKEKPKDDYVEPVGNLLSPTNGWRELAPVEAKMVQQLREKNSAGEYDFTTYDLSHVIGTKGNPAPHKKSGEDHVRPTPAGKVAPDMKLMTIMSLESIPSTEQIDKSPEEMADDTSRLFRRSELSLREEDERKAAAAAKAKADAERQKKEAEEKARAERLASGKKSSRFSSKKLKGMSKSFVGAMAGGAAAPAPVRRASAVGAPPRRASMQAAEIEKARDVIDDDEEEPGGEAMEGAEDEKVKPKLRTLFVMGEFDSINDMVWDGARRLRKKKTTDLDILLQNTPCPTPDTWVRVTGWSRVAPGSIYGKMPPADFDWERYGDQMRVKTWPRADAKAKPIETPAAKAKAEKMVKKNAAEDAAYKANKNKPKSSTDDAAAKMSKLSVKASASASATESSESGSNPAAASNPALKKSVSAPVPAATKPAAPKAKPLIKKSVSAVTPPVAAPAPVKKKGRRLSFSMKKKK